MRRAFLPKTVSENEPEVSYKASVQLRGSGYRGKLMATVPLKSIPKSAKRMTFRMRVITLQAILMTLRNAGVIVTMIFGAFE